MIIKKRCLAFLVGILATWVCQAQENPTYWVIQNVETGQFMQYHKDKLNNQTVTFSKSSDSDMKNSLWLVSSTEVGITIQNAGLGDNGYLYSNVPTKGDYKGYYKECFSSNSKATTFYLFPNPYNEKGYAVSSSENGSSDNKQCWYAYYDNNLFWLCSTQDVALNTRVDNGDGGGYCHLSTFRFLSFKDLYNQAKALNVKLDFAEVDSVSQGQPAYANYATLVNGIASALSKRAGTPRRCFLRADTITCSFATSVMALTLPWIHPAISMRAMPSIPTACGSLPITTIRKANMSSRASAAESH